MRNRLLIWVSLVIGVFISSQQGYAMLHSSYSVPAKNELLAPDSSSTIQTLLPTLQWKKQAVTSYTINVYRDIALTDTIKVITVLDTIYRFDEHLDFNTTYYWYVTATGGATTPSNVWTFKTFLPQTTLSYPFDKYDSIVKPDSLIWNRVNGVSQYNLQVSSDSMFSRDFVVFAQGLTYHKYPTTLLEKNRQLYWRVQAVIGNKTSTWSPYRSLLVRDPKIKQVLPDSAGIVNKSFLALLWNAVEGANYYTVVVSHFSNLSSPFLTVSNVQNPFYVLQGLEQNTQYFWGITAHTDVGVFPSTTWSFSNLSKSVLFQPANGQKNMSKQIAFEWKRNGGRTGRSFFQISDKPDFSNLFLDIPGTIDTFYQYDGSFILNQNVTYYWRVRQLIGADTSLWSDTWRFTVGTLLPTTPLFPYDNSKGIPLDTTIEWGFKEDADSYVLRIATNPDFSPVVFEQSFDVKTTKASLQQLGHNKLYYWQIRSRKDGELSPWSETKRFLTIMDKPKSLQPANNAVVAPYFLTMSWLPVGGAERYHIQIAFDSSMTNLVVDDANLTQRQFQLSVLKPETTYYWRVQSVSTQNVGQWSNIQSFKTSTPSSVVDDNSIIEPYPNPASSSQRIQIVIPNDQQFQQAILRDLAGKEIGTFKTNTIDLPSLPIGLYFIEILTSTQSYTKPLHIIK
ncbi:MAG: T9SS type A sorting domain-containing protein [Candidatus Kapabacteria bacterium]|nr:T9SS type A sorting domain-containing protein [Candidatus Kapabacteria bacterium]